MWEFFIVLFTFAIATSTTTRSISDNDIASLEKLFVSTSGEHWHWNKLPNAGALWNFSKTSENEYMHDPCTDNWQYICCLSERQVEAKNCSSILIRQNISSETTLVDAIAAVVLHDANLDGTLPQEFFNITSLVYLSVQDNLKLTGYLPEKISTLTLLQQLDLVNNGLGGTIPDLTNMSALENLDLNNNQFSGSLPNISGMLHLLNAYFYYNNFEGTLPALANLPVLELYYLDHNFLIGSLPSFSDLPNIMNLVLNNNLFEGEISSSFERCANLQYLYLNENYLHGSIPNFSLISSLVDLALSNNMLTGTIPLFYSMPVLTNLYLDNNLFVGRIPIPLFSFPSLTMLNLNNNQFTGTLPPEIGQLSVCIVLDLQDNLLGGHIPTELSAATMLASILMHGNLFSGSPIGCFPSSLVSLDVSENNLSGSFPFDLFEFPNIAHISMIKNCFSGSLPDSMCYVGDSLLSLALDGLTSGQGCQTKLLALTNSYTVKRFIEGTIPPCLFQLVNLHTLQLAGNGLTGQLAGTPGFEISPALRNLTLSHNRLTGTIPELFQKHGFDLLDLSFNKLSGSVELLSTFFAAINFAIIGPNGLDYSFYNATRKQLNLQVNRLSGNLPIEFIDAQNIQVVTGNLFGCSGLSRSGLPVHDPGSPDAQCGSLNLNVCLMIWVSMLVLWLVVSFFLMCWKKSESWQQQFVIHVNIYLAATASIQSNKSPSAVNFLVMLNSIGMLLVLVSTCILLFYLPFEVIIKFVNAQQFSTHLFQYAYTPSLAFVASDTAGAIVLCSVLLAMTGVWIILKHFTIVAQSPRVLLKPIERVPMKEACCWFAVVIVDVIVMIVVNGLYLYVSLYKTEALSYLALFALVVCKIFWNSKILPSCINLLEDRLGSTVMSAGMMLTSMLLFNNILAPMIVTICTQPSCFYNVFKPASDISATIEYDSINVKGLRQQGSVYFEVPHFEQISFQPPFTYSYQCSSALVTYYMPMYVIMFTYSGFISPLVGIIITHLYENDTWKTWQMQVLTLSGIELMRNQRHHLNCAHRDCEFTSKSNAIAGTRAHQSLVLMHGRDGAAAMICMLATLLTFGISYPLLSVLICTAGSVEIMQWRVLIGRYLTFCGAIDSKDAMMARLERSCCGVGDMVHQSRWLLILGMSLFFALFLFDMTGDKSQGDLRQMGWGPLTVLLWPIGLKLMEECMDCWMSHVRWQSRFVDTSKLAAAHNNGDIHVSYADEDSYTRSSLSRPLIAEMRTSHDNSALH